MGETIGKDKKMILISVKSEVVDDKRQFESDKLAMKYLVSINKLHHLHRRKIAGPKPKPIRGKNSKFKNRKAKEDWQYTLSMCVNLRVEIINTKINQLRLSL